MKSIIRTIRISLLIMLAAGVINIFHSLDAHAAWLDRGWKYRKSHVISSATGAGTNYQIKVVVHKGSGSDSGENVYLGGNCQDDFDDIRFTDNDETTELDYWMEEYTSGDNAIFWVEVADDLGSNATIYLYYGNNSVTTTSNGSNTFLFFDDFSGTLAKWTTEETSGVYPQIEAGGFVRMGGGSTTNPYGHTSLGSSATYSGFNNNAFDGKYYLSTNSIGEQAFRGDFSGNTGYKGRSDDRAGQGQSFLKPPYSGWNFLSGCTADASVPNAFTWYKFSITTSGTTMKFYRNGTLKQNCTDSSYSSAGEVAIQNHYGSYTDYDDVRVRKFVDPEPSNSTWGSEEILKPLLGAVILIN